MGVFRRENASASKVLPSSCFPPNKKVLLPFVTLQDILWQNALSRHIRNILVRLGSVNSYFLRSLACHCHAKFYRADHAHNSLRVCQLSAEIYRPRGMSGCVTVILI
jgi:hypothetical protein